MMEQLLFPSSWVQGEQETQGNAHPGTSLSRGPEAVSAQDEAPQTCNQALYSKCIKKTCSGFTVPPHQNAVPRLIAHVFLTIHENLKRLTVYKTFKATSPLEEKRETKYLQFKSKLWSESASSRGHSICHQRQWTALEKADFPSLMQRNHLLKCWAQVPNKLKIQACEWSFPWDGTATTDSQPHCFPEDDRRSMMAPQVCFRM